MFVLLKEFTQGRCPQIFQKSTSHLQILSTRWRYVICSIPRFCSSGLTCEPVIWCFLLGACELIHVTVIRKNSIVILKISGDTVQNLVTWNLCNLDTKHAHNIFDTHKIWEVSNLFGPHEQWIPIQMHTLWLLIMGIVVPETCWASNKICNKNLCCIYLAFYFHINRNSNRLCYRVLYA